MYESRPAERATGEQAADSSAYPLVVELAGTLVSPGMRLDAMLTLLREKPLYLFCLPFWLLGGPDRFERRVAAHVAPEVAALAYNQPLLALLGAERRAGRSLVLATRSGRETAERIAAHLGLFDSILTVARVRRDGSVAEEAQGLSRYANKSFDYVGNGDTDLAVLERARRVVLVDPGTKLLEQARRRTEVTAVLTRQLGNANAVLAALRPHQWLKNLLVLSPLLAAHTVTDAALWLDTALAFVCFGLCASSGYVLNDLLDLPSDRAHPRKRQRPLASGALSVGQGVLLVPALALPGFVIGAAVSPLFLLVLAVYYVASTLYSLYLRGVLMADVLVLAGLYTSRIIGGAAAIEVMPSFWFLAFSMFLFLSLALTKRYAELISLDVDGAAPSRRRGYAEEDLGVILSLGTASGFMAVLVLALYINSPKVGQMYEHPVLIWLLCPLLLYWTGRIWFFAHRGRMHDDPLIFALRDSGSRWVAVIAAAIVLVAV